VDAVPERTRVPWHALRLALAVPAIERVLGGEAAERVVDRALRGLSQEERRAMAEAIFGVGLWRRRLAWQAGASDASSLLRALIGGLRGEPDRLADRWSLPDWLSAHLVDELGSEVEAFCAAIAAKGPICLRANRKLCTREELALRLSVAMATRPCARARDGLIVLRDEVRPVNLFGQQAWREGWFEPQDEGSQLVTELVTCGEVLDLCAGAGGKSLQLASLGRRVTAFDIDGEKLGRLRTRAARAGAVVEIVAEPRAAECVLVDAPCSELGTLRRGPDARWRIRPEALREWLPVQRSLLSLAARLARREIVYVTCTVNRAENESMAAWFTAEFPSWHRTRSLKLLPHLDDTDGFFAASFTQRE
jgi:16S rRNA (cytosine967-C5)-methyltransferase